MKTLIKKWCEAYLNWETKRLEKRLAMIKPIAFVLKVERKKDKAVAFVKKGTSAVSNFFN
jgi:hypothetical protein